MAQNAEGLNEARAAARSSAWPDAVRLYEALSEESLGPEDLETKADALWWTSHVLESLPVRQRAYAGFVASGQLRRAAYVAWFLYQDYFLLDEPSVASGWLMRAKRDLADEPECREHGFVALADAGNAQGRGDAGEAVKLATGALEIGKRVGDVDLIALAVEALGRFEIYAGNLDKGRRLLDEAMTFVLSGGTSPLFTGVVFCNVLTTCFQIADLRRATEWTAAATRWSESMPGISPFNGLCRVHKVEISMLRGEWDVAESDARRTSEELVTVCRPHAAGAVYALGEILRRRGDLASAEEEFSRAHGLGHEPQPGLALVRLAQGDAAAASAGLRIPLAEAGWNPIGRAWLLAAQVEIALANNDVPAARAACDELDELSVHWSSPVLEATAWMACARRRLAEGDAAGAATDAHRATRLLGDLRMPFEAALTRLVLGLASREAGDEERARLEIGAAQAEFERLGAKLDARRAGDLLGGMSHAPGGLSDREVEVLRLVAAGKTNREIAAEMVISEHTVSRHLQNIFRKLDVSSRAAATAFAFSNGLVKQSMV